MRKVIVATNVAEASVTIDGVGYVIDSGLVKVQRFVFVTLDLLHLLLRALSLSLFPIPINVSLGDVRLIRNIDC